MRWLAVPISPALALSRSLAVRAATAGRRLLSPTPSDRELGRCADCRQPVRADDPFLRYRGAYYHGGGCVECDPPAARRRADLAGRPR